MITIPFKKTQSAITIPPKPTEFQEVRAVQIAVNAKQACDMLGISSGTLTSWTKKGLIPHRRVGGRILYSVEALKEFVSGKKSE